MPRYHFNVQDEDPIPDETGVELEDLEAAKLYSVRVTAGILRDEATTFWINGHWRLEVADDAGRALFALNLRPEQP